MRSGPSPVEKPKSRLASRASLLVALALFGVGAWLIVSPAQSQEVNRVSALARVEPAGFEQLPNGSELLLEGRLLARDPVNAQGCAAYTEQYFLRRESEGASKGREQLAERSV